jgi:hypothetical protein
MNGMNVTKSGRWMTAVFNEVFDEGQRLFRCRQMSNLAGFRKEMERMRDVLDERLRNGHETHHVKQTCEHCRHWSPVGKGRVCRCPDGRQENVETGAAWTCELYEQKPGDGQ